MKVEIPPEDDGTYQSFMVGNTLLGRSGLVRVIRKIPGCQITRMPRKPFSWTREDEFCEFQVNGIRFVAEEPFGDSSSFWIGCEKPCDELNLVIEQFKKQKWPTGL